MYEREGVELDAWQSRWNLKHRADAMLDKGDLNGYAVWKRVLRAVEELQGTEPGPGGQVH